MLLRCSVLCLRDGSLSLTLPTGHRHSQSLIAVTELCLYATALDASVISKVTSA